MPCAEKRLYLLTICSINTNTRNMEKIDNLDKKILEIITANALSLIHI